MQPWEHYKIVSIQHGKLVDRIKNKTQKDWLQVCKTLNIVTSVSYGRGSHAVAYRDDCPPTDRRCCILTIPSNLYPVIQRELFKKLLAYGIETGSFNEEQLWEALGINIQKN